MPVSRISIRPRDLLRNAHLIALLVSVLLHLLLWIAYEFRPRFAFRMPNIFAAFPRPVKAKELARKFEEMKPRAQAQEPELVFIETAPDAAQADAPKNPKYYSSRNTRAANPEVSAGTTPKIEGQQTLIPKLEEAAKPSTERENLQPKPAPRVETQQPKAASTAPEKTQAPPKEIAKARPIDVPGDAIRLKKLEEEKQAASAAEKAATQEKGEPRARTIADAKRRKGIAGQKMKQNGGVAIKDITSVDSKATPFGEYDELFIAAVQQCWYNLLEDQHYAWERRGRVVVEFRLLSDGRISDLKIAENTVDGGKLDGLFGYICARAIEKPSPYAPWPPEVRRIVQKDYRDVRFTFYYD